jgi:hypothetical protein
MKYSVSSYFIYSASCSLYPHPSPLPPAGEGARVVATTANHIEL